MAKFRVLLLAFCTSAAALAGPAVTDAAGGVYTVDEGDTLIGIAATLDVRLADLLRANGLTINSVILPGQNLRIPGSGGGSTGSSGGRYTVRAGDTLSGIAGRHDVSLTSLLRVNGMTVDSLIMPGMRLALPAGASSPSGGGAGASGGARYTVRAGDTLYGIAGRHGVSLNALMRVNSMTANSLIMPGMRLVLPAGASTSSGGGAGGGTSARSGYTVRSGDTLSGIADRHSVGLSALLAVNRLTVNSLIVPGMRLSLPAGATADRSGGSSSTGNQALDAVLSYARAQLGKPYKFFTRGPSTFDCSGLTLAAYAQAGIPLIHHAASQARQGTPVDFWSEPIRAGDLVFLAPEGNRKISHVGIATSSTTWIQSRRPGTVVQIGPLPSRGMITAVRRYISSG